MTNAGDQGDKPQSETGEAPSSGGYEAPPIEQTHGQSSHEPPPGATPSSGPPASGYPPPGATPSSAPPASGYAPHGGYPPPQGYPPADAPPTGYGPPGYQDPSGYGPPPYSSQPQYGAPPPSYPSGYGEYSGGYGEAQQPTNTMAIGSLVASLIGVVCGIGSIVGIVLDILALNQIKQSRERGHGLAVAGIAVGAATLIISLILNFYWFSH